MKTREQVQRYNKEYSARPDVVLWAKIRNSRPDRVAKRKAYKKTESGRKASLKYSRKPEVKLRVKNVRMQKRYGITASEYNNLYLIQGGMCAICLVHKDKLQIDHCHSTNKVRGLLCGNCNRALGLLYDNIDICKKAIDYLKQHGRTD